MVLILDLLYPIQDYFIMQVSLLLSLVGKRGTLSIFSWLFILRSYDFKSVWALYRYGTVLCEPYYTVDALLNIHLQAGEECLCCCKI